MNEPNVTLPKYTQLTLQILFEEEDLPSAQVKPCRSIYRSGESRFFPIKKRIRKLKVYSKRQSRKYNYTVIPEIRLSGKWLKALGFEVGKVINIECANDRIVITKNEIKLH